MLTGDVERTKRHEMYKNARMQKFGSCESFCSG